MSYFEIILTRRELVGHDNRPLWQYNITLEEFNELTEHIRKKTITLLDCRDAALYYAEWWKYKYDGGTPSKQRVFDSLNRIGGFTDDAARFYRLAREGGRRLRFRWISTNSFFYFRTLLLQGGLPVVHIENNNNIFLRFLSGILKLQPECIEDFSLNSAVTNILPVTSQNEIIYDLSYKVVKCVLNKEQVEIDNLINSFPILNRIINALVEEEKTLIRVAKKIKPQNFWILKFSEERKYIYLKLGLRPSYTMENLSSLLEHDVSNQEYQLFVGDQLICKFNKMLSGKYKTNLFPYQVIKWNGETAFPDVYVYSEENEIMLNNFIHLIPNISKPSLWTKYSDKEWRLIKGNNNSNKEGAVLFLADWNCNIEHIEIELLDQICSWVEFEGEVILTKEGLNRRFLNGVQSYDWVILSDKPTWLKRSNMPVIKNKPTIQLFNETGELIGMHHFQVYYEIDEEWASMDEVARLPVGTVKLKIEMDEIVSYDTVFNIGNFSINIRNNSLQSSSFRVINASSLQLNLKESQDFEIKQSTDNFEIELKPGLTKIPLGIKAALSPRNGRSLRFEIDSPFQGLALVDKNGDFVHRTDQLCFTSLHGLRILSQTSQGEYSNITFINDLKPYIQITKQLQKNIVPLLFFRDELSQLFSLEDSMNHKNKIKFILSYKKELKEYYISTFNGFIHPKPEEKYLVNVENKDPELSLSAVPLNCSHDEISIIAIERNEVNNTDPQGYRNIQSFRELMEPDTKMQYSIPENLPFSQLILFSSPESALKVMPRFFYTGESELNVTEADKMDRIEGYHTALKENSFEHEIWKQILAYFFICRENDLPFSTFDHIRAIVGSSEVAAKAFFFLGSNWQDPFEFGEIIAPKLESDLGFYFHWINKEDWRNSLNEINDFYEQKYFLKLSELFSGFMNAINMSEVLKYIMTDQIAAIPILHHQDLMDVRARLGQRVLGELPNMVPHILENYRVPIERHIVINLLLHSPIAAAESILGLNIEYPLFGGGERRATIRRNIQYAKFLNPELYKRILLQVLNLN